MAKNILAWSDSAQQFYREIGKRENGKAFRFYLGADPKQAAVSSARLEALWAGVEKRWQDFRAEGFAVEPFPCWDAVTIQLGKAIGKGEYTIELEYDEPAQEAALWLASLRYYFTMIQITIADKDKLLQGNQEMQQAVHRLAEEEDQHHQLNMRIIKGEAEPFGGKIRTQETLFDALDAYKEWIRNRIRGCDRSQDTNRSETRRTGGKD